MTLQAKFKTLFLQGRIVTVWTVWVNMHVNKPALLAKALITPTSVLF